MGVRIRIVCVFVYTYNEIYDCIHTPRVKRIRTENITILTNDCYS